MRKIATMVALWGATCLLTGCSDEPDFDARYAKANAEIQERIDALDAEEARIRAELGVVDANGGDRVVVTGNAAEAAGAINFQLPVPDGVSKATSSSGE